MEIVLRAGVIYFFLWGVTRAVGRTTLGELSAFELLLYVVMGDLVQQAVTQQDYSVTGGVLTICVFAVLTTVLRWTQWRFPKTRPLIHGKPIIVIRNGEIQSTATSQQRISTPDLLAAARQQGIRDLKEVELAILENDGKISFFSASDQSSGAPETAPTT